MREKGSLLFASALMFCLKEEHLWHAKTFLSRENTEERLQEQVANSPFGSVTASTSNVKENLCYKNSQEIKQTCTRGQTNGVAK